MRRFTSKTGSFPPRYEIGQAVRILHEEESGDAEIASSLELHGAQAVLSILAGVLILFGMAGVFYLFP